MVTSKYALSKRTEYEKGLSNRSIWEPGHLKSENLQNRTSEYRPRYRRDLEIETTNKLDYLVDFKGPAFKIDKFRVLQKTLNVFFLILVRKITIIKKPLHELYLNFVDIN